MQIQLKAPKIFIANEAVDFRKAIDGLSALVAHDYNRSLGDSIYVFYNRARNKIKLLAYHRNGMMLIYKRLDKKKFSFKALESNFYELDEKQLSWLLAGLDWVDMSSFSGMEYDDYF